MSSKNRAPIRWAGSKQKILPALELLWGEGDKRYLEAFAGSASLFHRIDPRVALLNDANCELIAAYRVLASEPERLYDALSSLPVSSDYYYRVRSEVPAAPFESAVRFFYLNRYCFNGIYRTNKKGQFNVPFGAKTGGWPNKDSWCAAAKRLKRAKLSCGDFESFIRKNVRAGDFVYMDPPYVASTRRVFAEYSAAGFDDSSLRRLRDLLAHIDDCGATFVLSFAQGPETKPLSAGWYRTQLLAQRNVASEPAYRRKAIEVIISNDKKRLQKIRTRPLKERS